MVREIKIIKLSEIKVPKHNVRKHNIDKGLDDLCASIKALGLKQPITVYFDSDDSQYEVLMGQRRLNAFHLLNKDHPNKGFDELECIIDPEPETKEDKIALSLAENLTQTQMDNTDIIQAVTDLYNVYHDYDQVKEKFGLTKYMIDKYVKLARLPPELKTAIESGAIHPTPKTAENAALRAVDGLTWVVGNPVEPVLELAKEYAKNEIPADALDDEVKKGGSLEEVKERAKKKPRTKVTLTYSDEIAAKLAKVSKSQGVTAPVKAIAYITEGVNKDYSEDLEE